MAGEFGRFCGRRGAGSPGVAGPERGAMDEKLIGVDDMQELDGEISFSALANGGFECPTSF